MSESKDHSSDLGPKNENLNSSFDRLGYTRGKDGRAVAVDPVASRLMSKLNRQAIQAFKRLDKLAPK